jgi:plasmid stability protein
MAQSGWRLPDDLLKRVRVHCAESGERQNEFVREALENALAERTVPSWTAKEMWESPLLEEQFVEEPKRPAKKRPAKRTTVQPIDALKSTPADYRGQSAKKPPAELPRIAPRHWGKS